METRQFGKTDIWVSVLGFGGAEIGFEKVAADVAERVLNDALDAGLNVIDTAECYLDSEDLIGRIVGARRKDYYLFTKCGHPEQPGQADWTRGSLLATSEACAGCGPIGSTSFNFIAVPRKSSGRAR
jgi:aryl-alcohol dehydrogenase-like predicted oxidoreductase